MVKLPIGIAGKNTIVERYWDEISAANPLIKVIRLHVKRLLAWIPNLVGEDVVLVQSSSFL